MICHTYAVTAGNLNAQVGFSREDYAKLATTTTEKCVPNEKRSPMQTSGVRIGTAAETTRGKTAQDFVDIAQMIDKIIRENT